MERQYGHLLAAFRELVEGSRNHGYFFPEDRAEAAYAALEGIYRRATRDPLTGVDTGEHLREQAEEVLRRPERRYRPAVSLLRSDLDNFKNVNDMLGHDAGDGVLRAYGWILRHGARRGTDLHGREGGGADEFISILPGADADGAAVVARSIKGRAEVLKRRYLKQYGDRLTPEARDVITDLDVSMGIASTHGDASYPQMRKEADLALYAVKHLPGKGRKAIGIFRGGQHIEIVPLPEQV